MTAQLSNFDYYDVCTYCDGLKVPLHRRTTVRRKVSNGLGFKHLSVEVHFVKRKKKSVSSLSCHKGVVIVFF